MKYKLLLRSLVLLIAAVIILWSNGPFDVDDAPITYRYAENLAAGNGFVYNPGEQILGTSTPLYALLLTLSRLLGLPIPLASNLFNFAGSLMVILLTMLITERLSHSQSAAILAACYLLVQGSFVRYTMAGMETPVYTALILGTFWLALLDRLPIAAFVAGLAAIMRLDGLAVGGALFLTYLLAQWRIPWRAVVSYGLTLLPWTLFAFFYFGSPIPLSMLAKQEHLRTAEASRYWIWWYLFTGRYGAPIFLLPLGLIGGVTLLRKQRWSSGWTLPLIWLGSYLSAYTIVGIDFYEWYLMPAYPVLAIFVGTGLAFLFNAARHPLTSFAFANLPAYVAIMLLCFWFAPYARHLYSSVSGFQAYLVNIEHNRIKAGEWLRTETTPDAVVYSGAIGHLGYHSGRYIVDGAGLITPIARLYDIPRDYYATDGHVASAPGCGAIQEFLAPTGAENLPMMISACNQEPYAQIGALTLANMRIGQWTQKSNRHWSLAPEPLVELQWEIATPQPATEWAVYMHFLNGQGEVRFQRDHQLGLQRDQTVYPLNEWTPNERIYSYVALPDDWLEEQATITSIRIGVWNPATSEYLPITAVHDALTLQEGLLVPVKNGVIGP